MKSIEKKVLDKLVGSNNFDKLPEDLKETLERSAKKAIKKYKSKSERDMDPDELVDGFVEGIDKARKDILKKRVPEIPGELPEDLRVYPKTVLALSGGGIKGCYEVGALYYLSKIWDKLNVIGVCGTSTGAMNALVVSESGKFAASKLASQYLGADNYWSFFRDEPWYLALKTYLTSLGVKFDLIEMLEFGMAPNIEGFKDLIMDIIKPFLVGTGIKVVSKLFNPLIPFSIPFFIGLGISMKRVKEVGPIIEAALEALQKGLKSGGFLNLDPAIETLTAQVDFNRVGQIPLRMYMVQYEDGKLYYMDQDGKVHKSRGGGVIEYPGDRAFLLKNGVRASASIPFFFPATGFIRKEGSQERDFYIDGGVRENMPLVGAKEMGAERIISMVCAFTEPDRWEYATALPIGGDMMQVDQPPPFFKVLLRSLELFQYEMLLNEIDPPYKYNDDIKRIPIIAHEKVIDGFHLDPGLVRINMDEGYMNAYDAWLYYSGETPETVPISSEIESITSEIFNKFEISRITITGIRKEIWNLEHYQLFVQLQENTLPIINPRAITRIRELKRLLFDATIQRFKDANEDPDSIPIKIVGSNSEETNIHDWWKKWERHGDTMKHHQLLKTAPWTNPWGAMEGISAEEAPDTDLF